MKTIRTEFRKMFLDKLTPSENRYDVIDTKVDCLHLLVYPKGTKTYSWVKKIRNRRCRIIIGRYESISIEQARDKARKHNGALALGGNPYADLKAEKNEPTFKQLYEFYYTQHVQKHTKRPEDNRSLVDYHLMHAIGNLKVSELTTEKVGELHTKIGNSRGKSTANKVINRISTVYNFGIRNQKIKCGNPTHGIKRYKEYARERFFNRKELKSFFDAVSRERQLFQDYFHLLLYTGARKTNVLSMEYDRIDLSLKHWQLSGDMSKNDETNIVALSEPAIEILKRRMDANAKLPIPSLYVFPGDGKKAHLCDPKRSWQRIRDRMGTQDITMHDLRRTLGSYMAIGGKSIQMIAKTLNHKSLRSTAIYARLSQDPILEAVNETVTLMDSDAMPTFEANCKTIFEKNNGPIKFRSLVA